MSFGIGRGIVQFQILKNSETGPISERFEYFDKIMHKHCYRRELDRGIAKCHLSSVEAMPRSKNK